MEHGAVRVFLVTPGLMQPTDAASNKKLKKKETIENV